MIEITSVKNDRIKEVVTLLDKSKTRREQRLFVVEGFRELVNCVNSGYIIESIFFNPNIIDVNEIYDLIKEDSRSPYVYSVTNDVYAKIAYRESTEGIVAIMQEKRLTLNDVVLPTDNKQNPLILVIENVEKPGNLGALLRTADACGVDAILVCDPLTDLYNPNLIRASLGGVFTKQIVVCTNEEAYNWLSANKIAIFTAQLQDSKYYYNTNMVQSCAIVMGSEAYGLSNFWRDVSSAKINIPMLGKLDSLNVSVSAAVLCYEAVRQRNMAK
ncbi:MAG: RNA methyltransferase [Bacteroidales bacterium]